jgi:hypothetical protein
VCAWVERSVGGRRRGGEEGKEMRVMEGEGWMEVGKYERGKGK